jgi:hypothetical protein
MDDWTSGNEPPELSQERCESCKCFAFDAVAYNGFTWCKQHLPVDARKSDMLHFFDSWCEYRRAICLQCQQHCVIGTSGSGLIRHARECHVNDASSSLLDSRSSFPAPMATHILHPDRCNERLSSQCMTAAPAPINDLRRITRKRGRAMMLETQSTTDDALSAEQTHQDASNTATDNRETIKEITECRSSMCLRPRNLSIQVQVRVLSAASNRTNSYSGPLDQYYTKQSTLRWCAEMIDRHVPREVSFIDFSAGYNHLAQALHELSNGQRKYIAFDIDPPADAWGTVTQTNWFDKTLQNIPQTIRKGRILIGFNPPYGNQLTMARRFIEHAITRFQPEWFALLMPQYGLPKSLYSEYTKRLCEFMQRDIFYTHEQETFHQPTQLYLFERKHISEIRRIQAGELEYETAREPGYEERKTRAAEFFVTSSNNEKSVRTCHLLIRRGGTTAGVDFVVRRSPKRFTLYRERGPPIHATRLKEFLQQNGSGRSLRFEGHQWSKITFLDQEWYYNQVDKLSHHLLEARPFDKLYQTRKPESCNDDAIRTVLLAFCDAQGTDSMSNNAIN